MKMAMKISYKENTLSLLKNLTTKELIIQVELYVRMYAFIPVIEWTKTHRDKNLIKGHWELTGDKGQEPRW